MKRSKFRTRDGLVMLLAMALLFILVMWLILPGILQTND